MFLLISASPYLLSTLCKFGAAPHVASLVYQPPDMGGHLHAAGRAAAAKQQIKVWRTARCPAAAADGRDGRAGKGRGGRGASRQIQCRERGQRPTEREV